MYHFAIVAFLGLATLKVVDLLEDYVPGLDRIHALLTLAVGVAAALALDYSVFRGFGVTIRNEAVGKWSTGLVIGSMATTWRAAFEYLGSSEGEKPTLRHHDRPRIAA